MDGFQGGVQQLILSVTASASTEVLADEAGF